MTPQAPSNLINAYTFNTELSEEFIEFLTMDLKADSGIEEFWELLNFMLGYGQ